MYLFDIMKSGHVAKMNNIPLNISSVPLLILLPNRRDVRGRWPVFKQVLKGMDQVENE
jgi:hypothetical protein